MKIRLAVLLLLLPFLLCAQTKKPKKKPVAAAPQSGMYAFYAERKLSPDSAVTPYLYYQVYDWIGTHYKYSGETKKGIDCSGFVSRMYKDIYCINLSGGSKDLWTVVTPVEKTDLKEGDILFFRIRKGQISHVGIYLGNNKFAHASVHSGVIVSDLDEEYYKKYFYKGGRIGEKGNVGNKAAANKEKTVDTKVADNKEKAIDNKKETDNKDKAAGSKQVKKPAAKKQAVKPAEKKIKLENTNTEKTGTKSKK